MTIGIVSSPKKKRWFSIIMLVITRGYTAANSPRITFQRLTPSWGWHWAHWLVSPAPSFSPGSLVQKGGKRIHEVGLSPWFPCLITNKPDFSPHFWWCLMDKTLRLSFCLSQLEELSLICMISYWHPMFRNDPEGDISYIQRQTETFGSSKASHCCWNDESWWNMVKHVSLWCCRSPRCQSRLEGSNIKTT